MAADGFGVIILRLVVELVKKVSPESLVRFKNYLAGKTLVIVGPARAGKSTLSDYLQHGELEEEGPMSRTTEVESTASFAVNKGHGTSLEIKVRRAIDVPGHHLPSEQVAIFSERQPDALLVVTDLTTPLDSPDGRGERAWFDDFCNKLADELLSNKEGAERLQTILIILNKKDRSNAAEIKARTEAFKTSLDLRLRRGWGSRVESIQILPCVLVRNPEGTEPVDAVIRALARSLD